MLHIELSRFRVRKGMSEKVDEWLDFLNRHMEDTLLTLENEKMYVESIHREVINGEEFLYWYSVQGDGGIDVTQSESEIDRIHLQYWDQCIDPAFRNCDIPAKVVMIPHHIRAAME